MYKYLLVLNCALLLSLSCWVQAQNPCPQLNGFLINSCANPIGIDQTEGLNEMVVFHTGIYEYDLNNLFITWSSGGGTAFAITNGFCIQGTTGCPTPVIDLDATPDPAITANTGFTTNPQRVTELNAIAFCPEGDLLFSPTSNIIPADATVIVFSGGACWPEPVAGAYFPYDFSAFCGQGPIYVIFRNDCGGQGKFVDDASSGATMEVIFTNAANGCASTTPCAGYTVNYTGNYGGTANNGTGIVVNNSGTSNGTPQNYNCNPPGFIPPTGQVCDQTPPDVAPIELCGTPTAANPIFYTIDVTYVAANATLEWYNAQIGGTLLGTSNTANPDFNYTFINTNSLWVLSDDADCINPSCRVEVPVTSFPLPTVAFSPLVACVGTQVSLDATSNEVGATFAWYIESPSGTDVTGSLNITDDPISFTPTETGSYLVSLEAFGANCSNSIIGTLTVNPSPSVNITGGAALCAGQILALTATVTPIGTTTYNWSATSGGAIAGATNGAVITATAPGTYNVTVTQNGCSATDSQPVSTSPAPIASIAGATAVCTGASFTLTASGAGVGGSYSWSAGAGGNISGANNTAAVTITSAATYTVTVTNSAGCTNSTSHIVSTAGSPTATISGATDICTGGSGGNVILTGSGAGAGGTYIWAASGGGNIAGATNQAAISATATGTYTVTITNSTGCTATAQQVLTAASPPVATISTPTATICPGSSVTLSTSGGVGYQWSLNGTPIVGATNPTLSVSAAGSYAVTVTSAQGCSASDIQNISSAATNPTATISGGSVVCPGAALMLTASGAGVGGSYNWAALGGGSIVGAVDQAAISATNAGTYAVTVTSSSGCTATANQNVSVGTTPNAAILGLTQLCVGDAITLTASGGTGFQWQQNGSNMVGQTANTLDINTIGTYTVVVTNAQGCTALSPAHIVSSATTPTAGITGGTTICSGMASVTLTASGGIGFQWQLNGTDIAGATNNTYSANAAGTYSVEVSNVQGCIGTDSHIITNTLLTAPTISGSSSFCVGGSTSLSTTVATGYQWQTGGSNIPGATINPYAVTAAGTYTVVITDAMGCTAQSVPFDVSTFFPPDATTIPPPTALCNNNLPSNALTLDLDNLINGALGGIWTTTAPNGTIGAGNVFTADGLTAGSYTVTYTVAANPPCVAVSSSQTLNVQFCPANCTENAQFNTPADLCGSAGTVLNLNTLFTATTTAGGTWTTNAPAGTITGSNTFDANGLSGTYNITYIVAGAVGCPNATFTLPINVIAPPTALTIAPTVTLCSAIANNSLNLTPLIAGDLSGTWTCPQIPAAVVGNTTFNATGLAAGDYTLIYTVTAIAPCTGSDVSQQTVSVVSPQNTNLVQSTCVNNYVLGAGVAGAGAWSVAGALSATVASPNSPTTGVTLTGGEGNYTFVWTPATGNPCINTVTIELNYATTGAFAGDDDVVCGATYNFGANGGIGNWIYTGPGTAVFGDVNSATTSVAVSDYGSYTFTWTITSGICSGSDQVTVFFFPEPTADPTPASANEQICSLTYSLNPAVLDPTSGGILGDWTDITGSSGIAMPPDVTCGWQYTSPAGATVSFLPNINTPEAVVTVSQPGTYTFAWVCNGNSISDCGLPNIISVQFVEALQLVTDVTCLGTTQYTVSINISGGLPPYSANGSAVGGNSYIQTYADGIDYSIIIDDNSLCNSQTAGGINPSCGCPPVPSPVLSGDPAYCVGESIPTFSTTPFAANYQYNWYVAGTNTPLLANSLTFMPPADGDYYVIAIVQDGCTSLPTNFSIFQTPNPPLPNVLPSYTYCQDETVGILATTQTPGGTLYWISDNGSDDGSGTAFSPATDIVGAVSYQLFEEAVGFCVGAIADLTVTVSDCACPTLAAINGTTNACSGETIALSAVINDPAGNLDHIEWHDENGNLVSENITRTITGCTAQIFNYTLEIYCNTNPSVPFQIEAIPITFYPIPTAIVALSNNGCTLTATPTCPTFAIVGSNTATSNTNGDNSSISFAVVNTAAQAVGLNCANAITGTFDCSFTFSCPTISNIPAAANACSGGAVSLSATIDDPNNSTDHIEWLNNLGAVIATTDINTTLSVSVTNTATGCNPQIVNYTFNVYCDDDPTAPSISQIVPVTFYPTPSATIDISADGCTALATPDCPNFSIQGSPVQSGTGTNSVTFTVRNNDAIGVGIAGGCATTVSGNFNCSTTTPCPTISPIADMSICSGQTINIIAAVINPANMTAANWTDELGNVVVNGTDLNGLSLSNFGCNVLTRTYTCNVFCNTNPTIASDQEAVTISIYPVFNAALVSFDTDPACIAPPTVSNATCADYMVMPVDVPNPQPGNNTSTWQITYNNGIGCFDTLFTYDYSCSACFTVTNIANATASICDGDTPNWAVIMTNVAIDDNSGSFGGWQWYTDAALSDLATPADWQHQGNSCEPYAVTFYAGGICTLPIATAPIPGGQVSVTVYPDFDVSLLQPIGGDCNTLPSLITTCANYILTLDSSTMPTLPISTSGIAVWNVAFSGSSCFLESYQVPYVCGGCPVGLVDTAAPATACSGELLALGINVLPNSAVLGTDYTVQWQANGIDIVGATGISYSATLPTTDCNTLNVAYSAVVTCIIPGGQPSQTLNMGTVTIHPIYNEANIAMTNTDCQLPTVTTACDYNIGAPAPPPIAGQSGTAVWTVSSLHSCFIDTTVTLNYNCPQCPTITTAANATQNICDGTLLSTAQLAVVEATVIFTDNSGTANGFVWYADAALTQPLTAAAYAHSGSCDVEVFTLYIALRCTDGSQQVAGTLTLSSYPTPTTVAAVGGCSLQVNPNCVGNLTIEYLVGGIWQTAPPLGIPTNGQTIDWRAYVAGAPDNDADGNPDCMQSGIATAQSCNCIAPATPPMGVVTVLSVCAGTTNTDFFEVTVEAGAFAVWYNAAGDSLAAGNTYVPTTIGTYTVQAFSLNDTCAGPQITATLSATTGTVVDISYAPDTLCLGGVALLPTVVGAVDGNYSASGGIAIDATTGAVMPDVVGTFTVTFVPTADCDTGDDAVITVESCLIACVAPPSPVAIEDDLEICAGDTNTTAFSVQAVAADMVVVWYNSVGDSIAAGTTYVPTVIGTYFAQAEMLNDTCVSNPIVAILSEVLPQILSVDAGSDITVCEGDAISLQGVLSGNGSIVWSSNNGGSFGNATALSTGFTAPDAGTYTVLLTANGVGDCVVGAQDTLTIVVQPTVIVSVSGDDTILEGESTILTATGATNYAWAPVNSLSCADCAVPTATPVATTTYLISTTDACSEPVAFTVTVNELPPIPPVPPIEALLLPDAFSPNGDGINDIFGAQYSGTITDYYMVVYNRWGQKMFETTDLNLGWDGKLGSQDQELGVYVYYATYTFAGKNEDLLRGNVTLIR